MSFVFKKHYTIDEARTLLPQVRQWLDELDQQARRLRQSEERLRGMLADGADVGGPLANDWARVFSRVREILSDFQQREIQIKDIERGLIDFPALRDGREVFLCWEKDEDNIEFWHDIDTGYSSREKLEE